MVEVDDSGRTWRKSVRSGGESGNCLELAMSGESVLVRTSRNRAGPRLAFSVANWTAFLSALRDGITGSCTCTN